jgi:hypothetical protein
MSKPKRNCVFCDKPIRLTKSHVWPEWAEAILPQTATHHEQITGRFNTFTPKAKGPAFRRNVRPGNVGKRKPRNTCGICNGGWMRLVEEATMPFMRPLLLGQWHLLTPNEQRALAALLCLVSMRLEFSGEMRAIPKSDRDWLKKHSEPSANWQIWIASHEGEAKMDQQYTALQIASSPNFPRGVEHCNTQVTSLVIGHLYAHLFSSTVWRDFPGYEGIDLRQIWPLDGRNIVVSALPFIRDVDVPWLHETIARTVTHIGD